MQHEMKVETLKHKNINGKELLYIVITNKKGEKVIVNVGEKNHNKIQELINDNA